MNHQFEFPYDEFFSPAKTPAIFREAIIQCFSEKRSISLSLLSSTVAVSTCTDSAPNVEVRGSWISTGFLSMASDQQGSAIIYPLFFDINEISLPYNHIYTAGHAFRSAADFFSRNLYNASLRNDSTFLGSEICRSRQQSRGLRRQYFYIIKAEFKERCLENKSADEILDLLLINAYLPMLEFEHPLLRYASESVRRSTTAMHRDIFLDHKRQIHSIRSNIIKNS